MSTIFYQKVKLSLQFKSMQAQKVVYLCQRQEYGNERKFHPPDLTDQELDAIFVQSKSENKTLKQNTLVLYRKLS